MGVGRIRSSGAFPRGSGWGQNSWYMAIPLGGESKSCLLPSLGWGNTGQPQALLSLTGGALCTQVEVGATSGVAERQQSGHGPHGEQGRTLTISHGVEGTRPCAQQPRSPIPQSHSEPGQSSPHGPAAGPTPHSFPAAARPH